MKREAKKVFKNTLTTTATFLPSSLLPFLSIALYIHMKVVMVGPDKPAIPGQLFRTC